MSAEKSKALILKILPYRESSCILHLFTEEHGLVHGVAKGVRKQKSKQDFLERGFLIELIVYMRPHRELHTVGSVNVLEFFSAIRSSLIKSTLRDAAFETVLSSITESDVHPELFDFFVKFLHHLQNAPESDVHPFALWLFYHRFSQHMGFGLDLEQCLSCGSPLKKHAFLAMNIGGLECDVCCESKQENFSIPVSVLTYLTKGSPKPGKLHQLLPPERTKKITWLLADYCRYHFDIQKEYKALLFLDEMTEW
jgi:DNA repair protein RecO (recombination protein O)